MTTVKKAPPHFDIQRNSLQIVRIRLTNFNDKDRIDLRLYYRDDEADTFKPTKKGISIYPDQLGKLIDCLEVIQKSIS